MVNAASSNQAKSDSLSLSKASRVLEQIPSLPINTVMGIDYSGSAKSGRTAWAAELILDKSVDGPPVLRLVSLQPLGRLAASDDRERVNEYLTDRIRIQKETLWGCDFPFGLPIELSLGGWRNQLDLIGKFNGNAKEFGRTLVELSLQETGSLHVRRTTDQETKTPFDCYHYRIIYQTFHGMRDILANLIAEPAVAILPFQYRRESKTPLRSIIAEACPSSTLKKLQLPFRRYKQSGGQAPTDDQKHVRRAILAGIKHLVEISPHRRKVIMNDPGGDALDAVLAGVGVWTAFVNADHREIANHPRYHKEGYVYC
ncbi:DUF429 domain-containing protein [Stieleria sp. JC731]|uniref:DUF429 domain-containing protein n=1 Tax=Pirellulaceae TaxID=2691357 RepID=UPI001E606A5E|nr:DUF429 domain-containing protein [Stieleria sp. JC731]MCC9599815.1 DUF429 domain-containing protein [Stieleria sp. JC731]